MMPKHIHVWLLAILTWASTAALAAGGVPPARDLQKDAAKARAMDGAILMVLVGEGCFYCKRALNEFLIPMSRLGDYQGKVVMRQLEVAGNRPVRDFNGQTTTAEALAQQYTQGLVPTVLLLDAKGKLLAKPVVGLTTVDYYGMYLDDAIDAALAKLRGKAPL